MGVRVGFRAVSVKKGNLGGRQVVRRYALLNPSVMHGENERRGVGMECRDCAKVAGRAGAGRRKVEI